MSDLNITFDVFCLSGDSFNFYHSKLIEEYFRHFFQPPNLRKSKLFERNVEPCRVDVGSRLGREESHF